MIHDAFGPNVLISSSGPKDRHGKAQDHDVYNGDMPTDFFEGWNRPNKFSSNEEEDKFKKLIEDSEKSTLFSFVKIVFHLTLISF